MNQIIINLPVLNATIKIAAKKAYDESNPLSLQMLLHYMDDCELRELMNWTDDENAWKPKVYALDRIHFCIVADAMLRYYYDVFSSSKDGVDWEDADGNPDFEEDPVFIEEREYWEKVSTDNSAPIYPYLEDEDPEELLAYSDFKMNRQRRPRLFSRDIVIK
jgi:hypothetical protein